MKAPAELDSRKAHVTAAWKADRPLVCCRFDPQGRYVFCGLEHSAVARFALAGGKRVIFEGGHESWVFSLGFASGGARVFTGGGDGRLVAWDAAADQPTPLRKIAAHQGWIRSMASSPDGKLLATGGNDRLVKVWDADQGACIHVLTGHAAHIYSVEFHPGGRSILSGDLLGEVREWELASGRLLGVFDARPLHTYEAGQQVDFGGVRSLAVSPDGKWIAASGLHKASNPLGAVHEPLALLFDPATRKQARQLTADGIPGGVFWRSRFLADGSLMAATGGSSGGILLFFKTDGPKDYHRFALPNILRDMDLHPDGQLVATAHHDRHVRITRLAAKTA